MDVSNDPVYTRFSSIYPLISQWLEAGAVQPDTTSPQLTITSHTNNQNVSISSITISGTATDSGRGDSGILSVTVNNVRASNDTAVGAGTATWNRTLTLSPGTNTITVVARDNSASQNATTSVITINYVPPPPTTTPGTASAYHVFPQFADGRLSDGSYYRTTIMIVNSSNSSGTCTLRLYGLTVNGSSVFNYGTFPAGSWNITTSISSMQNLKSGYATLQCGMPVEAQLLYSFYSASGAKISEATVFSSPSAESVLVLADNREGSRLAIAVANDSDQSRTYVIAAYNNLGNLMGSSTRTLAARSNLAVFVDDLITLPPNYYGPVLVFGGSSSVIGLRFSGSLFTTIPAIR